MATTFDNVFIANTTTITYNDPKPGYDYNQQFPARTASKILENSQYILEHNGEPNFEPDGRFGDLIVGGYVMTDAHNQYGGNWIAGIDSITLTGTSLYIPPQKVGNVYVEKSPVSQLTLQYSNSYLQPYFDGTAYGGKDTGYMIRDAAIGIHPMYPNTRSIIPASDLQSKAQAVSADFPIWAAALSGMTHGAIWIDPKCIYHAKRPQTGTSFTYVQCFSQYEYYENFWIMPFASDDEYEAAYAVLYIWNQDVINYIHEL